MSQSREGAAMPPGLPDLFEMLRQVLAVTWPGRTPRRIEIHTAEDAEPISLPVPAAPAAARPAGPPPFVPTPFQEAILDALEGQAMRASALGASVGDKSRLYRRPGGLHELREQGLVDHHPRLGYYRPDAPPDDLAGGPGQVADQ